MENILKKEYYYGNAQQIRGVEEYRLVEGKASQVRMMHVRNGKGLEVTICPDRCTDITRLVFKGDNLSYYSPCGTVAPSFYDCNQAEMLRTFTAGFLTTCGVTNVGSPCVDDGEELPLHGRISHEPAEHCFWHEEKDAFVIEGVMRESHIFSHKLELHRKICIMKDKNQIKIEDTIKNKGEYESPCMILYHMNMGYPLLSEHAQLTIPSIKVEPRDELAASKIEDWQQIDPPRENIQEVCYFHSFDKQGLAKIYNHDIKKGVEIKFDTETLNCFTQWKMMGKYDYVLGLEPGNCRPDGRKKVREENKLVTLKEGDEKTYCIEINILEVEEC